MKEDPNISLIIPVYNASRSISACIDSILRQSYEDFELILVNDGSKDDSAKICHDYASRDSRIKYIEQVNQGASAARNKGLSLAKGQWAVFVDSDDTVEPNYLLSLIQTADRTESLFVIAGVKVIRDGIFDQNVTFPNRTLGPQDYKILFNSDKVCKYGFTVSKLYNIVILRKYNLLFDSQVCIAEDLMFMIRYLISLHSEGAKISSVDACEYNYLMHSGSLSTSSSNYEMEVYSSMAFKLHIAELLAAIEIDAETTDELKRESAYYTDRVIRAIYASSDRGWRLASLREIDVKEYALYKTGNTMVEKMLVFLLCHRLWRIFDFFRSRV